jgi:8-oxo-dGTP pyrophosphatase MutT (NUDIX family)
MIAFNLPPNLADRLAERLAAPLPGRIAQRRFAPELSYGRHLGPAAPDARKAAVVALLYPHRDQWFIPLTLRPNHMAAHADQISFPGGLTEENETSEQAALRELQEELGIGGDKIRLLGRMSPLYVFASNFQITPCVAIAESRPAFTANPAEVAEIVQLPLDALVDARIYGVHEICRLGLSFRAPHITCDRHRIWGATCMILGELAAIVSELVDSA